MGRGHTDAHISLETLWGIICKYVSGDFSGVFEKEHLLHNGTRVNYLDKGKMHVMIFFMFDIVI